MASVTRSPSSVCHRSRHFRNRLNFSGQCGRYNPPTNIGEVVGMASLDLALLGGFTARLASGQLLCLPRAKARALIAILALQPGQTQARDKLTSVLWPEFPDDQARHSLRQTLFMLRKRAPSLELAIDGDSLILPASTVTVDVAQFRALAARGTPDALAEASSLYRGDLLEGLRVKERPFEDWLLGERERLRELAIGTLRTLLAHHSARGATDEALQAALRLVSIDPLNEPAHRALIGLYAATGRRALALRQYETLARGLKRELDVAPEPETVLCYEQVLRGDGWRAPSARAQTSAARLTPIPLVGRDHDLARLTRALDGAWLGHGASIAIVGEAGVGKTRLVEELADRVQRRGGRILLARSFEMEQVLSFGCWLDALRPIVAQGAPALRDLEPIWRRELARFFPEAGVLRPPPTSAPNGDLQLFEAVGRLLDRLAVDRPQVLIFEDLHWADEMSLRLLSFVAHRIAERRVLLVVTAREEEVADIPRLKTLLEALGRDARHVRLALRPLSRTALGSLTRYVTTAVGDPGAFAALEQRVWEVSEGNPFVALETVRALEENGLSSKSTTTLPFRVTELITNRLDRLDDRVRDLVEVAAVIGREFEPEVLQRAAGLDAPEAASAIQLLARRSVLVARGDRLDFVHDRVREVALGHLLPPRRRLVHAQVATAIAQTYERDLSMHAGRLAMHYREGHVWDKALPFLVMAGRQAAARTAHREAVACYEHALDALGRRPATSEDGPATIEIYFALRYSLAVLDERERVEFCLREAERRSTQLGDSERLGWALCHLSRELLASGRNAASREHAERALGIGESMGYSALASHASYRLAQASLSAGDYQQVRDRLTRMLAAADAEASRGRESQLATLTIQGRAWLGWALGELGDFEEGLGWGREALQLAENRLHDPYSMGWACTGLAEIYRVKGDLAPAVELLERVRGLAAKHGLQDLTMSVTRTLGNAYALSGRLQEGLDLLRRALAMLEANGYRRQYATCFIEQLGRALLIQGEMDEAYALALRALALARARGERGWEAYSLWLLGDVAAGREHADVEIAERHYRAAIALATELAMRPLIARAHRGLGMLYKRAPGNSETAHVHLATANAMAHELGLQDLAASD
jgi:DNA-binding SARP family transcriptional activator